MINFRTLGSEMRGASGRRRQDASRSAVSSVDLPEAFVDHITFRQFENIPIYCGIDREIEARGS
jgi:hypothetical protein